MALYIPVTILVIDDDPGILSGLARLLRQDGHIVEGGEWASRRASKSWGSGCLGLLLELQRVHAALQAAVDRGLFVLAKVMASVTPEAIC